MWQGNWSNWMLILDFLTTSMNYIPVSVENQVNVDASIQDSYVAGSSGKDKGPTQEYILLSLQPHRTRIPVKDVGQMPEDEQVLHDELEKMVTQELTAKAMDDVSRQAFEEEKRKIASQKKAAQATSTNTLSTDRPSVSTDRPFVSTDRSNTPYVSVASTPTGVNASESSFVYLGGKIPIDASTLLMSYDEMKDVGCRDLPQTVQTEGSFKRLFKHNSLGNKRDERSIVVKNKARLIAQGFRQEEGIDYDEVFALVARIEAISQDKYVADILKKFDFLSIRTATTPIESNKPLVKDERINGDYGGASLDRIHQQVDVNFLVRRLISWQCKKQTIMANSTTEAEYVAAANYCGQVLWIQNQMMDYGFNFMNTKIHIDNESTISVIKNHVAHSRTKHIKI
ncbi:putative ribonuclease H-like domain-containing protein [Tanacetum coccineum]